jgi:hypothetical protein
LNTCVLAGSRDYSLLCSLAICIDTAPSSSSSSFCCSCSSACSVPAPTPVSTPRQAQQKLFQAGHRTVGLGNPCPRNCHLFALPEFHPRTDTGFHPSASSAEATPDRSPNCWARKHLPSELPSLRLVPLFLRRLPVSRPPVHAARFLRPPSFPHNRSGCLTAHQYANLATECPTKTPFRLRLHDDADFRRSQETISPMTPNFRANGLKGRIVRVEIYHLKWRAV